MRYLAAMLITGAVAWMPAALSSECFSIQDADHRNVCLAAANKDKSYCFKIQNVELREGCQRRSRARPIAASRSRILMHARPA